MRSRFSPWVRKIPWRREWQAPPVFLPGESHGRLQSIGSQRIRHDWSDLARHILQSSLFLCDVNRMCPNAASLSTCCCSVAKSCQSLCNPVECTMPSSSNYVPGFARVAVHWVDDAIYQLILLEPLLLQPFQASGSFTMSQLFPSGGQCIGALASPSLLPMNFQDWFPLGLTGLISLPS